MLSGLHISSTDTLQTRFFVVNIKIFQVLLFLYFFSSVFPERKVQFPFNVTFIHSKNTQHECVQLVRKEIYNWK
jgi:hypothetical protein